MLAGAALIAAALSACSSSGSSASSDSKNPPAQLQTQIEAGSSDSITQRGLELRVLTVDDSEDRVARMLARYQQDLGPLNAEDRKRWNSWGLRLIAVPVVELDALLGSQDLTQAIQVRWMGEFPQWRPVIRTGKIRNDSVRVEDSGSTSYRSLAGRPRLLARVWTSPKVSQAGVEARLNLDLAVQMTQEQKSNQWGEVKLPTAIDEGELINDLKISPILDSSTALVLVGEDPLITWVEGIDGSDTNPVSIDRSSDGSLGPTAPGSRTLGQQMLSTAGTGYVAPGVRYVPPKKVLIILVPKVGGQYRLLGPTMTQGNTTP